MNDPLETFSQWYSEARERAPIDPNIVALASASKEGRPSVRMVFYRGIREGGFSFFTNYQSRKAQEYDANPYAAMVFHWSHLGRQVRVEGPVARLSSEESDSYFLSRPFESQITALVSRQSRPMEDLNEFRVELRSLEQSWRGKQGVRPEHWGGFKIVPAVIEFWTRGEHRRHDRTLHEKEGEAWNAIRLYP